MNMDDYIDHINNCDHCDYRIWFHCQDAHEIIKNLEDPQTRIFFASGRAERLVQLIKGRLAFFAIEDQAKVGRIESATNGRLNIRHAGRLFERPASQCFSTLEEIKKWIEDFDD